MTLSEQLAALSGLPVREIEYDLACAMAARSKRHNCIMWTRHFPWLKKKLGELQGNFCCWCDVPLVYGGPDRDTRATFEHIIPINLGGADDLSNLALAHAWCNERRPTERLLRRPVYPWDRVLEAA